ncbi:hypothetical protein P3T18_001137 [Paraburkholderia sp. GAS199]|uniref:hypothetical protein n=1 Tax=Paraburkholderia sp. GAS199 TaxID=3035126 RepID=UPI003D1C0805
MQFSRHAMRFPTSGTDAAASMLHSLSHPPPFSVEFALVRPAVEHAREVRGGCETCTCMARGFLPDVFTIAMLSHDAISRGIAQSKSSVTATEKLQASVYCRQFQRTSGIYPFPATGAFIF